MLPLLHSRAKAYFVLLLPYTPFILTQVHLIEIIFIVSNPCVTVNVTPIPSNIDQALIK